MHLFFSNPNRSFYVREITRKIDEQINSVRRELANLLTIGIIASDNNNNRLYYEVNQKYEFYGPLSVIFGGAVNMSVPSNEQPADHPLKALGNVELVLYTGQFTRDETSGVDMVIVGDINQTKLVKFIEDLEKQEGKELRYVVMALDEFRYRRQVNDRFLMLVLGGKSQVVIDKHGELTPKAPKKLKAGKE